MNKIDTVLFDFGRDRYEYKRRHHDVVAAHFPDTGKQGGRSEVILGTFGEPLEVTMRKFFPDVPADGSGGSLSQLSQR